MSSVRIAYCQSVTECELNNATGATLLSIAATLEGELLDSAMKNYTGL